MKLLVNHAASDAVTRFVTFNRSEGGATPKETLLLMPTVQTLCFVSASDLSCFCGLSRYFVSRFYFFACALRISSPSRGVSLGS